MATSSMAASSMASSMTTESVQLPAQDPCMELNKTFTHILQDFGFDALPKESVIQIFKDGRVFSHFIEHWLTIHYPLTHIKGCKSYDFTAKNDTAIQYDQKTFTSGGCRFMPSNMIGEGRSFDQTIFEEKAKKLIYIIVSNINFPRIKVKAVKGIDLIVLYPKGVISSKDHDKFFN